MNGEQFPNDIYKEPSEEFILGKMKIIDRFLDMFCNLFKINKEKIQVNTEIIRDIVIRMDKREIYFHIYHNDMEPSEYKKLALFIYWVLKLRPFWIPINENFNENNIKFAACINEKFCIFMVTIFLRKFKPSALKLLKTDYIKKELPYSFRFRDLSKESLYLIFDALRYA